MFACLSLYLFLPVVAPFGGTLTCHTNARPMITLSRAQRESCRAKRPRIAAKGERGVERDAGRVVNSLFRSAKVANPSGTRCLSCEYKWMELFQGSLWFIYEVAVEFQVLSLSNNSLLSIFLTL